MKNLNFGFGGRRARDSVRRVLSGGAVAAGVAGERGSYTYTEVHRKCTVYSCSAVVNLC